MAVETRPDLAALEVRARHAYERGRAQRAAVHALGISVTILALAWISLGRASVALLPLPVVVWTFLGWRGGAFQRGGRLGLAAGVATLLLPVSLMRTCCRPGMAAMAGDCCGRPSVCTLAGAGLGLWLAWWVPRGPGAQRLETASGMMLGLASAAVFRCRGLFVGESLGLFGGLVTGIIVASVGVALFDRFRSTAVS